MVQVSPPLTETIISKEARDLLMYEIGLATRVGLHWMTGGKGTLRCTVTSLFSLLSVAELTGQLSLTCQFCNLDLI